MTLFEQINHGIKEAMRNRDQTRLETLRMLKSKILTVDARGDLSDGDILKLFKTYQGNLHEALEHAKVSKRADLIEKLECELVIVQEFLPKMPSAEETRKLVVQAIADSGAKTKKDLGLVMKAIMKQGGAIDGKAASELANQLLAD